MSYETAMSAIEHYQRGLKYYSENKFKESLGELSQAIALEPDNSDYYAYRARSYWRLEQIVLAWADCEHAFSLNAENPIAFNMRGILRNKQDDKEGELADYNEAIRIDPTFTFPYINRGRFFEKQKDFDKALMDYNEAIRLAPDDGLAYWYRARLFKEMKDYFRANRDYTEALRFKPNDAHLYISRAGIRYLQGDFIGANEDLSEAIRLEPENGNIYSERGHHHHIQNNLSDAFKDYTEALRLKTDYPEIVYHNRGQIRVSYGDFLGAVDDYTHAILHAPDMADNYVDRGDAWYQIGELKKALMDYQHYLELADAKNREFLERKVLYLEANLNRKPKFLFNYIRKLEKTRLWNKFFSQ